MKISNKVSYQIRKHFLNMFFFYMLFLYAAKHTLITCGDACTQKTWWVKFINTELLNNPFEYTPSIKTIFYNKYFSICYFFPYFSIHKKMKSYLTDHRLVYTEINQQVKRQWCVMNARSFDQTHTFSNVLHKHSHVTYRLARRNHKYSAHKPAF